MSALLAQARARFGIKLGPASRVSLGLTSLMLGCLLLLDLFVGVVPDDTLLREVRERTSRQIAAEAAGAIGRGDTKTVHQALNESMARENQVVSIGVRRGNGEVLAQTAEHPQRWKPPKAGESDIDNVRVPLLVRNQPWGEVEISFVPVLPSSLWEWIRQPKILLFLLLGGFAFLAFALYLRRVLEYLDPSAVIPGRVRSAFDAFTEGVMVVDAAGRVVLGNAAFRSWAQRLDGSQADPTRSQRASWAARIFGPDAQQYPWMRAMRARKPERGEQIDVPQDSGEPMKLAINCAPIQDARGAVRGCIVTFDDLTEIERVNAQLRTTMSALEASREQIEQQNKELLRLATRDALTGCFNRRAFFEMFNERLAAARANGEPLTCIMTDIDHFKSFNDRFGHAVGDRVLQVVSRALTRGIRDIDVLGRYGGEEFCIVLPNTALETAKLVAERLRASIEATAGEGLRTNEAIVVTSSFGLAELGPDTASAEDLLDKADKALYEAKRGGRNRVAAFGELPPAA